MDLNPCALAEGQRRTLDEQGFLMLEGVLARSEAARLRGLVLAFEASERQAGRGASTWAKIRQARSLLNRDVAFERCVQHRGVLPAVEHLLGEDCRYLASTASIVESGAPHYGLHVDYPVDRLPRTRDALLVSCIWLLDDFTPSNGATCCIPGSHLRLDALPEPGRHYPEAVAVRGRMGSVLVVNSATWHGTCPNRSAHDRVGLLTYYRSPHLDMSSYPGATEPPSEDVLRRASPRLERLLRSGGKPDG